EPGGRAEAGRELDLVRGGADVVDVRTPYRQRVGLVELGEEVGLDVSAVEIASGDRFFHAARGGEPSVHANLGGLDRGGERIDLVRGQRIVGFAPATAGDQGR